MFPLLSLLSSSAPPSLSLPTQLLRCLNCRLVNDVACSCSLLRFSSFSFACLIWHNFHFLWQRPEVATGWQQQQQSKRGGQAQDTARKLLSRQHFGCHSLGFCAAAWWHSMPQTDFFPPLLLFFFACILFFNFVKRMPDIVSPSHSSLPTRFVCFWRPPRGTFNVPQGHVIKYVSKAAAGGI